MARTLSRRRPANREPEDIDEETQEPEEDEEDEEEERPARSRRHTNTGRSTDRPSRRSRDEDDEDEDDDEDERPARKRQSKRQSPDRKRSSSAGRSSMRDGWGDGKMKSRNFDEERFTVDEDTTYLFRFAQDDPIISYYEHFLNELPKGTRKSYVCIEDGCPICQRADELGEKDWAPGFRRVFNVIVFGKKGNPQVKYWVATPGVLSEIENFAFDEDWLAKHGPLSNPKTYFMVSKSRPKKNSPFKFRLDFVRARDLEEEHGVAPLTAKELEELEEDFFTKKDVVKEDDIDVLEEIAEELQ